MSTEGTVADYAYPREHRLRRRSDFRRIFSHQNKAAGKFCVVLVSRHGKNFRGPARLGVVVSTKIHKTSVRRHQLKRWVRELFRLEFKKELDGMDLVVLFRRNPPADGHGVLDDEIRQLLPRAIRVAAEYKKRSAPVRRRRGEGSRS